MTKPTDIVSNIDTTGIAPGPTSNVRGTTPVFDLAEEQSGKAEVQDITLKERFKKLAAVGSQTEADDEAPEEDAPVEVDPNETVDTSGTDVPTSPSVGQDPGTDGGDEDDEDSDDESSDEENESEDEDDLSKHTIPELLAIAKDRDITIPSGSLKDDIITLIQEG